MRRPDVEIDNNELTKAFDEAKNSNEQALKFLALIMTSNSELADQCNLYDRLESTLVHLRGNQHQPTKRLSSFDIITNLYSFIVDLEREDKTKKSIFHNLLSYLERQFGDAKLTKLGISTPIIVAMIGRDLGLIVDDAHPLKYKNHEAIRLLIQTFGTPFENKDAQYASVYIAIQWVNLLRKTMHAAAELGDSRSLNCYNAYWAVAPLWIEKQQYINLGFDNSLQKLIALNEDMQQSDEEICKQIKVVMQCYPNEAHIISSKFINNARSTVAVPLALKKIAEDIEKTFEWKIEPKIIRHLKRVLRALGEFESDAHGNKIANHIAMEIASQLKSAIDSVEPKYKSVIQSYCAWLYCALGVASVLEKENAEPPKRRDSFTANMAILTKAPSSSEEPPLSSDAKSFSSQLG